MGLVACDSNPFAFNWSDAPDTVLLYSLARPELNLVSGFNFYRSSPVRVEGAASTGSWDVAIDTEGSDLVLAVPGVFGVQSDAAIAVIGAMRLEDVIKAPADTLLYIDDETVPVRAGTTYIIRTNRQSGSFGRSCVYYAKLEPVDIDVAGGTLRFRYVVNPVCNDRELVPPD